MGRNSQTEPRQRSGAATVQAEALLSDEIDRCRRGLSWRTLLRRLALLAVIGAIYPLLMTVADHVWPGGLPRELLVGSALIWGGLLVILTIALIVVTALHRINPIYAARLLERGGEIRHNVVVNALSLRRVAQGSRVYQAVARQAALAVRAHPPADVSDLGTLRVPGIAAGIVLAAWIIFACVSPKPVAPSLARFFGASVAAPTATRLAWLRPDAGEIIHVGDPLQIEVVVDGRQVEEIWLEIRPSGDMTTAAERYRFKHAVDDPTGHWYLCLAPHEVSADIHYRCIAGDAALTGIIPVQPRPTVSFLEVDITPPAYTGWAVETTTDPHLEVLAGTRATFRAQANVAVNDPIFVFTGRRENRLRMNILPDDEHGFHVTELLTESGRYHFEFTDRWNYPYRDPPEYHLTVRQDAPPTVELTSPDLEIREGGVVEVSRCPLITAEASDDIGIAELVLVRVQDGVQSRIALLDEQGIGQLRARGQAFTTVLGVTAGHPVTVWFEVADNRHDYEGRPARQRARTPALILAQPEEDPSRRSRQPQANESDPEQSTEENSDEADEQGAEKREDAPAETDPSAEQSDEESPEPSSESEKETVKEDQQPSDKSEEKVDPEKAGRERDAESAEPSTEDQRDDSGQDQEGDPENTGDANKDELERELKRFIEEHGEMAREVHRRLKEQQDTRDDSEQGDRDQAQDSTEGSQGEQGDEEEQPAERDTPAPGQDRKGQESGSPPERQSTNRPESCEAGVEPSQPERQQQGDQPNEQGGSQTQQEDGDRNSQAGSQERAKSGEKSGATAQSQSGEQKQDESSAGQPGDQSGRAQKEPATGVKQSGATSGESKDAGNKSDRTSGKQSSSGSTGEKQGGDQQAGTGESGSGQTPNDKKSEGSPTRSSREADQAGSDASGPGSGSAGGQQPGQGGSDAAVTGGKSRAEDDSPQREDDPPEQHKTGITGGHEPLDSEGAAEVIDLIDMLERGQQILPADLVDMGWAPDQAAAFVKALKRVRQACEKSGYLGDRQSIIFDSGLGDSSVRRGAGLSGDIYRQVDQERGDPDDLRRITPPAEQHVPPHLRAILEAYYKSLARHGTSEED
ncbi:MAG: hypothetical protein ABIG44_06600 [Planctomycetota bacterium]